jgi:hypothetical protein
MFAMNVSVPPPSATQASNVSDVSMYCASTFSLSRLSPVSCSTRILPAAFVSGAPAGRVIGVSAFCVSPPFARAAAGAASTRPAKRNNGENFVMSLMVYIAP